jgi:hypothetical protein
MHQTAGKGLNVGDKTLFLGSFIYNKVMLAFVQFFITVLRSMLQQLLPTQHGCISDPPFIRSLKSSFQSDVCDL